MKAILGAILVLFASTAVADEITGTATIVDGDTIRVWGTSIRLEGIDAPEMAQTCNRPTGDEWRCGEEAADRLKQIVAGKSLECRGDETDQYDRLIATCFLGGSNLNQRLVLDGWAVSFLRFSDTYVVEEQEARSARRGIWAGTFTRPVDFRARRFEEERQSSSIATVSERCVIKGNINSKGVKIYHTPWGSKHYGRTKIDTGKGERWFCNEAEAIDAGWRAPYR